MSAMSKSTPSFIEELKRRKVVRMATVYGAVVFVVVEVADLVFPALGFPAWMYSFVVVLALLGFPVALGISWVFDLTRDGVKRTEATSATAKFGAQRVERWISARTAAVALVLVSGGWLAGRVTGGGAADSAGPGDDGTFESIAVLPFVDMSPAGDQEYFGDGIAEELLNALAKIPNLKVAARTSAFSFKGRNPDIAMVAEALNVQTVLEGSIRKAGNQLRITAQLIRAEDGFHLWSETYDRPADDVFAVQDELARAIVAALRVQLTGEQEAELTRRGTQNVGAHNAYLLGRFQWNRRTEVGLRGGIENFTRAIELDSMYAEAYAGLADANAILHNYGFVGPEEAHVLALGATSRGAG